MSAREVPGYRRCLRRVVSASAAPYGYTLTIWTCGAVTTHADGLPSTVDALLFLLGAVVAFGLVGLGAFGSVNGALGADTGEYARVWAGLHLPSVGVSVLVSSLLAHLVPTGYVWPLVGFTATATYLLLLAAQFWVTRVRAGVAERDD